MSDTTTIGKRYRVAQWGTGHSGMAALRALIQHPDFDLVGVKVYSENKAGRDAGELCGLGPTGVIATRDVDDIIAAKPDCVVYMPVTYDIDDICRLLESGVNISTLLEHFHDPETLDPQVRNASRPPASTLAHRSTARGRVRGSSPSLCRSC